MINNHPQILYDIGTGAAVEVTLATGYCSYVHSIAPHAISFNMFMFVGCEETIGLICLAAGSVCGALISGIKETFILHHI